MSASAIGTKNVCFRWQGSTISQNLCARAVIIKVGENTEYKAKLPENIKADESLVLDFKSMHSEQHSSLQLTAEEVHNLSIELRCLETIEPSCVAEDAFGMEHRKAGIRAKILKIKLETSEDEAIDLEIRIISSATGSFRSTVSVVKSNSSLSSLHSSRT